jgi:hypothetical protein
MSNPFESVAKDVKEVVHDVEQAGNTAWHAAYADAPLLRPQLTYLAGASQVLGDVQSTNEVSLKALLKGDFAGAQTGFEQGAIHTGKDYVKDLKADLKSVTDLF